eukprot:scaffold142396_cov133-Phaeocystis_antarctica.AAC.2
MDFAHERAGQEFPISFGRVAGCKGNQRDLPLLPSTAHGSPTVMPRAARPLVGRAAVWVGHHRQAERLGHSPTRPSSAPPPRGAASRSTRVARYSKELPTATRERRWG